jgi:hypothetical protein
MMDFPLFPFFKWLSPTNRILGYTLQGNGSFDSLEKLTRCGSCQVKDLPQNEKEERARFNEKQTQKFTLKSHRRATKISDMTQKDIKLWTKFLRHVGDDEIFKHTTF